MIKTGLEFAPGTTDECKRLIGRLYKPQDILSSYREARKTLKTGDIALVGSEKDPSGFTAMPRTECTRRLRKLMGEKASKAMPRLTMEDKPAHSVVQLPFESEAMWLVVVRGPQAMPTTAVLFAVPFSTEKAN